MEDGEQTTQPLLLHRLEEMQKTVGVAVVAVETKTTPVLMLAQLEVVQYLVLVAVEEVEGIKAQVRMVEGGVFILLVGLEMQELEMIYLAYMVVLELIGTMAVGMEVVVALVMGEAQAVMVDTQVVVEEVAEVEAQEVVTLEEMVLEVK